MSMFTRVGLYAIGAFFLLAPALAHATVLENPGNGLNYSGIGVISGWKCEANGPLTVRFDGGDPLPLLYGSERTDVLDAGACGDANVGFVAIWNWGNLDDGEHTAVAYDNGVEFARSTFAVTTLGEPFVRGASAQVSVPNFPATDETATFAWNQNTQHLELEMIREGVGPENLDALLEPIREKYGIPALAGGIVHAGELIGLGAVGVRRVGSPERVTVQDRWYYASSSKSMTATLVALLVEEGTLSWQTTIGEAFPDLSMRAAWQAVTLEQLLSHRAGLLYGGLDIELQLWNQAVSPEPLIEQRRRLVELVVQQEPTVPPGSQTQYSNTGYIIAGAIAEAVTGQAWEELIAARLFAPLGMASVDFGFPGSRVANSQPRGHYYDGLTPAEPGSPDDGSISHAMIGPAGNVHGSIEDWGKYVAMHLAGARGESNFLKPETFQKLHTPAGPEGPFDGGFDPDVFDQVSLGISLADNYALGWWVSERTWAGGRLLNHWGDANVFHTSVWMAPHKDFAVLVVMNTSGEQAYKAMQEVVWTLIQHFLEE